MSKTREKDPKNLPLNKRTISNLNPVQMGNAKAGGDDGGEEAAACWENLWTIYECKMFVTNGPDRVVVK